MLDNSFLRTLYSVVDEMADSETRSSIFADPLEVLEKAYMEGYEAGRINIPAETNPYKPDDKVIYTKNNAWLEGFMSATLQR